MMPESITWVSGMPPGNDELKDDAYCAVHASQSVADSS
jgi:hypothetical protein